MKNTMMRAVRLILWAAILLVSAVCLFTDRLPDRVAFAGAAVAFLLCAAENFYAWRRSPVRGTVLLLVLNGIAGILALLCALTAG